MAPEVWKGSRKLLPTVDLWSLGVMLWEMATGRRLFQAQKPLEIYRLLISRNAAGEADEVADYAPELVPLLFRLLQRNPDDRYPTAFDVALKLRDIRLTQGAAPDLLQFRRILHASRVPTRDRHPSIATLPTLPVGLADWEALISLATRDPQEDPLERTMMQPSEPIGAGGTNPSPDSTDTSEPFALPPAARPTVAGPRPSRPLEIRTRPGGMGPARHAVYAPTIANLRQPAPLDPEADEDQTHLD